MDVRFRAAVQLANELVQLIPAYGRNASPNNCITFLDSHSLSTVVWVVPMGVPLVVETGTVHTTLE